MIVYVYFWRALWSPRYVNFMNLCLAIALLDIFSVLRGPYKDDEVNERTFYVEALVKREWLVLISIYYCWWEMVRVGERWWELMEVDEGWWRLMRVGESLWEMVRVCERWWELMRVGESWWGTVRVDESLWEFVRDGERLMRDSKSWWAMVRVMIRLRSRRTTVSTHICSCLNTGTLHGNRNSSTLLRAGPLHVDVMRRNSALSAFDGCF